MKKNLYFFLILIPALLFSQEIDKEKLDLFFNTLDENNKFMGSVALSHKGEVVYERTVGYDDIETQEKSTVESKYRIGSISKTFTASLILKAVEEKKLKLDKSIKKYFPKIKFVEDITIDHLLNHRSGIHSFTSNEDYLDWCVDPKSRKELLKIIVDGGSDFIPDSKAEYSNSNYVLLTMILEKIYKKSFAEILEEKIIKPLDLKNTYLGKKIEIENNECHSYVYSTAWEKENETDMSVPLGAGAIVSNPRDLNVFFKALFEEKIINAKSLSLMTNLEDSYGRGIFEIPYGEKKSYGHTGGIDGFASFSSYFKNEKLAISLTSNGGTYSKNKIVLAMLSAFFNDPYEIPNFEIIEVSEKDLEPLLGFYASEQMPLQITITEKDQTLFAQATGQSSFPLDARSKTLFVFEQAGIVLEFYPEEDKMILKQGGATFLYKKQK